jgi:SAM-dependent methyltransferase
LEQLGGLIDFPIGFDPDGDSLVEHRLPTLPRAVALAESIPLPAASVDAVFCSWVLEHLAYPERVFGEVSRCLRPGGAFVFLTPNKEAVVTRLNQALKPLQSQLVPRLYGRAESDTFPVVYRANTLPDLKMLAQKADLMLETCLGIPDPTYLAFHPLLYRIGVWLTQRTPPVHWVGVCRKIH